MRRQPDRAGPGVATGGWLSWLARGARRLWSVAVRLGDWGRSPRGRWWLLLGSELLIALGLLSRPSAALLLDTLVLGATIATAAHPRYEGGPRVVMG
jgi:hypothetical protein